MDIAFQKKKPEQFAQLLCPIGPVAQPPAKQILEVHIIKNETLHNYCLLITWVRTTPARSEQFTSRTFFNCSMKLVGTPDSKVT